jgi:hypothetical protein
MIISGWDDEDGDAADLRGAYWLDVGVAMLAMLAGQPRPRIHSMYVPLLLSYQRRCGYSVAVRVLHMDWRPRKTRAPRG